jgi:hypothetical protein
LKNFCAPFIIALPQVPKAAIIEIMIGSQKLFALTHNNALCLNVDKLFIL